MDMERLKWLTVKHLHTRSCAYEAHSAPALAQLAFHPAMEMQMTQVALFTCIRVWDIVFDFYVDKDSWQHQGLVPLIPQADVVIACRETRTPSVICWFHNASYIHSYPWCSTNSPLPSQLNHTIWTLLTLFLFLFFFSVLTTFPLPNCMLQWSKLLVQMCLL